MLDNMALFTAALGLEKPWKVDDVKFNQDAGRLDIFISRERGSKHPCPTCNTECNVHDTKERTWRHLNFFQYRAYIHCKAPRVKCLEHGVVQAEVPWARPESGFTMLFEALVIELTKAMAINTLAKLIGEHDTRIWRIVQHYVGEARKNEDFSDVEQVGVDETSSKRGHNYISVFMDLDNPKVIYVGPGRDSSVIKLFRRDLISHGGCPDKVINFSCDMSPAYIKGIETNFPQAHITFDKFHVMKKVNEAVDAVRRQEQAGNINLKRSRYIWLKNPGNLTRSQRERLTTLSKMNLKTARAYSIKLSLQEFWRLSDPVAAEAYLKKWYFWATHSRLEPMKEVAYYIRRHWAGILRYFKSRINNGLLEATNGLIQATKRKARGYRNIENLICIIYLTCGKLKLDTQKAFY